MEQDVQETRHCSSSWCLVELERTVNFTLITNSLFHDLTTRLLMLMHRRRRYAEHDADFNLSWSSRCRRRRTRHDTSPPAIPHPAQL